MRIAALVMWCLALVSGCSSVPDTQNQCGTVSDYLAPNMDEGFYRVVVTHLDGVPVISRPNYELAPGRYQFTVAELIDSPRLKVKLAARAPKILTIDVKSNQRYHIGAQFNQDKVYRGLNSDYWQPVVWSQEQHECELIPSEDID